MTSKERGQYIHDILKSLTSREEKILRLYFGLEEEKRFSLEEIGRDFEVPTRTVKRIKNRGLRKIRYRVINEVEDPFNKLKEYVEGINPDLIHKELPYHYSKSLDELMLCLVDGVENKIYTFPFQK